jgi:hypothetical protein
VTVSAERFDDLYRVRDRILLKDGTYLYPGDFCYLLWNTPRNPSRWLKAKLIRAIPGTSDNGIYEILKTGRILRRGRYYVKSSWGR